MIYTLYISILFHTQLQIHVDSHGDFGPPIYFPQYPFFRMPKNEDEIYYMMQKNDMFIQVRI